MSAQTGGGVTPIRVLLVDDHEVVRMGLRALLSGAPDIQVVGEAGTAAAAREQADRLRPDVVVLDVRLPDGSGVITCREIRSAHPDIRVLMLTSYSDDEALFAAILAGASAFLLKQARGPQVLEAIRAVHSGGALLDPSLAGRVLQRLRAPKEGQPDIAFSDLERRILDLIVRGQTNQEIGQAIFLSETAVKHHISDILRKLQVSRRSEAAAIWARRHESGGAFPTGPDDRPPLSAHMGIGPGNN